MAAIERDGQAEVKLAGRSFRIRREFLEDIARQRLDDAIASTRKPLLIFHGPKTPPMVPTTGKLDEKEPRSIISLDAPDHTFRRNGLRAGEPLRKRWSTPSSADQRTAIFAAGTDVGAADGLKGESKLEEDIAPPFR